MPFRPPASRIPIAALLLAGGLARAYEPETVGPDDFDSLRRSSPFLRVLRVADSYSLRGVARIGDQTFATLHDHESDETVVVHDGEANKQGMRLVEVSGERNTGNVSVTIAIGPEEAELRFEADKLKPALKAPPPNKYAGADGRRPPPELIRKYYSMSPQQREAYMTWREVYYGAKPELRESADRYPIVEKAIEAIKSGKPPPKP